MHQPMAFTQNTEVHRLLGSEGTDCLPLILVDGRVVNRITVDAETAEWAKVALDRMLALPGALVALTVSGDGARVASR